jgi:hypothetical protein
MFNFGYTPSLHRTRREGALEFVVRQRRVGINAALSFASSVSFLSHWLSSR